MSEMFFFFLIIILIRLSLFKVILSSQLVLFIFNNMYIYKEDILITYDVRHDKFLSTHLIKKRTSVLIEYLLRASVALDPEDKESTTQKDKVSALLQLTF